MKYQKYIDFHIHYIPELVPEVQILQQMDHLEIEKSVVIATPEHPRYLDLKLSGINQKVLELTSRHRERLVMAAYIDPRNVMEGQTSIERYYDQGVRLIKMWPGHGFSPDDPMIWPVWEKLNDLKMGVILHMGMLGVRPQLGTKINRMAGMNAKFGQPVLLDQPARMFPDITFIIAHTAYPWTLEALEMSFMFENIYIDFSCGLGCEAYNLIDRLRPRRLAWERFLFATDSAGTAEPSLMQWKENMRNPFFAPHADAFFYSNGQKLFEDIGVL